jgi:hypothetical protein
MAEVKLLGTRKSYGTGLLPTLVSPYFFFLMRRRG